MFKTSYYLTVKLFATILAHNIRPATKSLNLSSNRDSLTINQQAGIRAGQEVWFSSRAMTNILSLNISKMYQVTYNTPHNMCITKNTVYQTYPCSTCTAADSASIIQVQGISILWLPSMAINSCSPSIKLMPPIAYGLYMPVWATLWNKISNGSSTWIR